MKLKTEFKIYFIFLIIIILICLSLILKRINKLELEIKKYKYENSKNYFIEAENDTYIWTGPGNNSISNDSFGSY